MKSSNSGEIKNFAYNSIILTVSNVILKAANFLFLPLYTRYLTPAELGISDTITNFTAFILPLLVCGFDSAFSVFYFDKEDSDRYKKVFNTVQFLMMRISWLTLVFVLLARPISVFLFGNVDYIVAIDVALLGMAFNIWMLAYSLHIRMQGRMAVIGVVNIITSLIMLLLNVFFVVVMKMGYFSLILSTTIAHAVQLILFLLTGHIKLEKQYYDKVLLQKMFKYALPMLPITIVNWVLSLSDRYIVLFYCGESAVGLYGIAQRFVTVLNIVVSSVTTAFTTFAFVNICNKDADEKYIKILNYVYLLLIIIVFSISCFAETIIRIMTDESYYTSYLLLQPLMFGQLCYCVSTIIGYGFAYVKKSNYFIIPSSVAAILNLALNILFIPKYGTYAATITTFVGYLAMMYITYLCANRLYPCKYEIRKISIVLFLEYMLARAVRDQNLVLQVIAWIAGLSIIIMVFWKSIKEVSLAAKGILQRREKV